MPAFNLEHEQRRLSESGITYSAGVKSIKDNLRTLVAERTEAPSFFELSVKDDAVTSVGYEHRGDLNNSFARSETEAPSERIVRRYCIENRGYSEARSEFGKLPLYSTVMLFSPPPDEPIPGYPGHSFAYFYHILPSENEGQRTIKALAWINRFTKEDQAAILNSFNPKAQVLPTEESILTSPVSVSSGTGTESFQTLWDTMRQHFKNKGYSDFACPSGQVMQEHLLNGDKLMQSKYLELDIMIDDLAKRLANGGTRESIADDFDTMLIRGDKDWLHKDWGYQQSIHMNIPMHTPNLPKAAYIFAQNKSSEQVRQVMTFCGLSSGMSSGMFGTPVSGESQVNTWSFSVNIEKSNQSSQSEQTTLCCKCPFCEKEVEAKIEGGRIWCPNKDCGKSAPYKKSN